MGGRRNLIACVNLARNLADADHYLVTMRLEATATQRPGMARRLSRVPRVTGTMLSTA